MNGLSTVQAEPRLHERMRPMQAFAQPLHAHTLLHCTNHLLVCDFRFLFPVLMLCPCVFPSAGRGSFGPGPAKRSGVNGGDLSGAGRTIANAAGASPRR